MQSDTPASKRRRVDADAKVDDDAALTVLQWNVLAESLQNDGFLDRGDYTRETDGATVSADHMLKLCLLYTSDAADE